MIEPSGEIYKGYDGTLQKKAKKMPEEKKCIYIIFSIEKIIYIHSRLGSAKLRTKAALGSAKLETKTPNFYKKEFISPSVFVHSYHFVLS